MLEINTLAFLAAATNLSRTHQLFAGLQAAYGDPLITQSVNALRPPLEAFKIEADKLGARLAVVAAERLLQSLSAIPCTVTVAQAVISLNEIESRFADYLAEVKMFALSPQEAAIFDPSLPLISEEFSERFPSLAFDTDECAKCLALGRATAAVFHAMRMMEAAVAAVARCLDIPEPVRPGDKTWGGILATVKDGIEAKWPDAQSREKGDGQFFEDNYTLLLAVKNAWRNKTMHPARKYTLEEANQIVMLASNFLRQLAARCDEKGRPKAKAARKPRLINRSNAS